MNDFSRALDRATATAAAAAAPDVSPDNHPMDDIAVVFTKGDRDAIIEIRDTLRELKTELKNFDPSTLMASLLGGGGPGNPMGSILGSFLKS